MLKPLLKKLLAISFIALSFSGQSQNFNNITALFKDGLITIRYNLVGDTNTTYNVELRCSIDGFTTPITNATGDVGRNISPGPSKSIVWNPRVSLDENYAGTLQFKLLGSVGTITQNEERGFKGLQFTSPLAGSKFKRGKTAQIEWTGAGNEEKYNLEIFEGDIKVVTISAVQNQNAFTWDIPKKFNKGDYNLRLVGTDGVEEAKSQNFSIKAGLPLPVLLAPVALVGGGAVVLLGGGGGGGDELPEPPLPGQ